MTNDKKIYSNKEKFSDADNRAAARDKLVFNVTDDLMIFMEDNDVSKTELARRLGKSKSYVSQILSGSRNMTLGTFSDICFALQFEPEISLPIQPFESEIDCSKPLIEGANQRWLSVSNEPEFRSTGNVSSVFDEQSNVVDFHDYKEYRKVG